ncbi:MAG TPA: DUF1579 family protein [Anaerolineales bacterium]|nr:DUF1579 family protein [Anaerolineales bacterium]
MTTQESGSAEIGPPLHIRKLHSLVGDWDVDFETRGAPNESFVVQRISSRIVSILGGAFLQEELSITTSSGNQVELLGLLGYDRYREIYRFAWLDDKYAIFDVHEGNWQGDALVVNNLRSGTTFRFGHQDYFSRMTWHDITVDEFRVASDLSSDGGKTWFTQARSRYIRKK